MGRNPKTGARVEVPAKRIPYFKPSKELKDLVGIPIPIHVTGSFDKPQYALDTEALVEALGKSKVKNIIEEKVGDDRVKGLLKGLLK